MAPAAALAHGGPIDEVKVGVLGHDVPIGGDHREPGVDLNVEALFVSPDLLRPIFAPRPHLGLVVNSAGKTSYGYFGLTWEAMISGSADSRAGVFGSLGVGGAVHTGPDISSERDHKGLGTRVLFHESVELGYRFTGGISLSLFLDHISNANLSSHNPGLTNFGLRTGFKV
jgi:hypothetical protein